MSFRALLRPGQGFQLFHILRSEGETSKGGRPYTSKNKAGGQLYGILTEADPKEIEHFKQKGTPITHTILQRGTKDRAKASDILELPAVDADSKPRRFRVVGEPKNPGDLGHFLIYRVEERVGQ